MSDRASNILIAALWLIGVTVSIVPLFIMAHEYNRQPRDTVERCLTDTECAQLFGDGSPVPAVEQ